MIVFSIVFVWYYFESFQLDVALLDSLDYYTPIAGTVLLISILLPNKSAKTFALGFFYSILVISLQFGLREVAYPMLKLTPQADTVAIDAPYEVVLYEFDGMDFLPQKNGLILQNSTISFVFGTIAQQNPSSYIAKNIFFKDLNGNALFAEHAKIIDNQIMLYKTVTSKQTSVKNYLLPLPFNMESFFNLSTDPKHIDVLPILINNSFSPSFIVPITLALSKYLLSFILLIVIGIIAGSFSRQLQFHNSQIIGSIVTIVCCYPFVLLVYYFLSLMIQSIIKI